MSRRSLTFVSDAFRVEVYFRKLKLFQAIVVFVEILMGTMPLGTDDNNIIVAMMMTMIIMTTMMILWASL
jgi:hypothetical protein